MIRLSSIVWLLVCGLMVGGLFYVKYDVQGLEKELATLRKKNAETRDGIRILKAEWSLLNQATRLRKLGSKEKLDLRPITQRQLINIEKLPVSFIPAISVSERPTGAKATATRKSAATRKRVDTRARTRAAARARARRIAARKRAWVARTNRRWRKQQ